ncbi:MAG: RNA polymerase factor sigma-54 [Verrucomicrobia bacterium]|nr:RNA polymerase factor sigma-54 [Verrucomicrobiota bacterium]
MAQQFLSQTQEQRLQMVLAPQLRQSLEFLQVPVLELRTLIQQELEKNPTLEETPSEDENLEVEPGSSEPEDNKELDFSEEFEVLARLDDEWREYFHQVSSAKPYTSDDEARRQFFLDSISQTESLQEHLMGQISLTELGDEDRRLGEMLIGSINDDGYLTSSLEELAESAGYETEHLNDVLQIIKEFDPIGVGARDLSECLLLQMERLGVGDSLAAKIVDQHLDALGNRRHPEIARALGISVEEVEKTAGFIATLEPKPGRLYTSESASYVLAEVLVQKVNGKYLVILNDDQIPHMRISKNYKRLMGDPTTTREVKDYIRDKIHAGAFLIKSINQRQQTIRNISEEIVRVQSGFLDNGISELRPLTMAEVAKVCDIHETTVSRAIANKYMQTPRGTFEMKYFFTPGLKTDDGSSVSNKTIKDTLERLVADEDPKKPLSDQAMVEKLKEKGIQVARRTIAKYREELKILPSHMRKSFR